MILRQAAGAAAGAAAAGAAAAADCRRSSVPPRLFSAGRRAGPPAAANGRQPCNEPALKPKVPRRVMAPSQRPVTSPSSSSGANRPPFAAQHRFYRRLYTRRARSVGMVVVYSCDHSFIGDIKCRRNEDLLPDMEWYILSSLRRRMHPTVPINLRTDGGLGQLRIDGGGRGGSVPAPRR